MEVWYFNEFKRYSLIGSYESWFMVFQSRILIELIYFLLNKIELILPTHPSLFQNRFDFSHHEFDRFFFHYVGLLPNLRHEWARNWCNNCPHHLLLTRAQSEIDTSGLYRSFSRHFEPLNSRALPCNCLLSFDIGYTLRCVHKLLFGIYLIYHVRSL